GNDPQRRAALLSPPAPVLPGVALRGFGLRVLLRRGAVLGVRASHPEGQARRRGHQARLCIEGAASACRRALPSAFTHSAHLLFPAQNPPQPPPKPPPRLPRSKLLSRLRLRRRHCLPFSTRPLGRMNVLLPLTPVCGCPG